MKILVFQGSPRIGGNTDTLVNAFIDGAKKGGAYVEKIDLYRIKLKPCIECGECDKNGECVIQDDMQKIYPKLKEFDVVVLASPVFFYNITSMTQALVERVQPLWVLKYLIKSPEYRNNAEKYGILISLGATKGDKLFEGIIRVVKYFFDAFDARYVGGLFFRGVEKKGEIKKHPSALEDAYRLGFSVGRGDGPECWPVNRSDSP